MYISELKALCFPRQGLLPNNLITETSKSKNIIHHQFYVVTNMPIKMYIYASRICQQLPTKNQPLVHELEVFVVCPDVRVLLFLEGIMVVLYLLSAQGDCLLVVSLGVERRVNVD